MAQPVESEDRRRRRTALVQQLESWQQAGLPDVPTPFFEQALATWSPSGEPAPSELNASVGQPVPAKAPLGAEPLDASPRRATRREASAAPHGRGAEDARSAANIAAIGEPAPLTAESAQPYPPAVPDELRSAQLQVLAGEVAACNRCDELARTRTQTVFGVGPTRPRLCFVGEAPGADEDRQGEPFVGAAGQLLNKIIAACHLKREDIYILNVLKCRPPGNRTPSEPEMANCWHFARRQLEILQPEFICCLGAVAVRGLLQTKTTLGKLRGQFHQYRGSRVVVTYHPAYLLRNPPAKYQTWDDMKLLMREMGVEL